MRRLEYVQKVPEFDHVTILLETAKLHSTDLIEIKDAAIVLERLLNTSYKRAEKQASNVSVECSQSIQASYLTIAVTFGWLTQASVLIGPTLLTTTTVFLFDFATAATSASWCSREKGTERYEPDGICTYTVVPRTEIVAVTSIVLHSNVSLTRAVL